MIVCADDYGLTSGSNSAILELARSRCISAVSVMTAAPGDAPDNDLLDAAAGDLDIGLHLALTPDAEPLSGSPRSLLTDNGTFFPFQELVRRTCLRRIRETDARMEIEAQVSAFHSRFGRMPDYLDGHMHVQQLPVIRDAVVQISSELCAKAPFYVRNAWSPFFELARYGIAPLKSMAIALPAIRFRKLLLEHGVPTNNGFAGIYDFRSQDCFAGYFARFMATACNRNAIIMTHPGLDETWRRREFETLRDLKGVEINRFQHS